MTKDTKNIKYILSAEQTEKILSNIKLIYFQVLRIKFNSKTFFKASFLTVYCIR